MYGSSIYSRIIVTMCVCMPKVLAYMRHRILITPLHKNVVYLHVQIRCCGHQSGRLARKSVLLLKYTKQDIISALEPCTCTTATANTTTETLHYGWLQTLTTRCIQHCPLTNSPFWKAHVLPVIRDWLAEEMVQVCQKYIIRRSYTRDTLRLANFAYNHVGHSSAEFQRVRPYTQGVL